jgi:hypothetical protein
VAVNLTGTRGTGPTPVPDHDGTRGQFGQVLRGDPNLAELWILGELIRCHVGAGRSNSFDTGTLKSLTDPVRTSTRLTMYPANEFTTDGYVYT